jgi:hypothetical protein
MPRIRRPRLPEVAYLTPEIHAYKDHVTAVFWIGDNQSVGIRFESPEHILRFMELVMDKAAITWPDNEWIKEYLSD